MLDAGVHKAIMEVIGWVENGCLIFHPEPCRKYGVPEPSINDKADLLCPAEDTIDILVKSLRRDRMRAMKALVQSMQPLTISNDRLARYLNSLLRQIRLKI